MTAYAYSLPISQLQDVHIEKNKDKLIDVLQMDNIQIKDVISTLEERLEEENEAEGLGKAKGRRR